MSKISLSPDASGTGIFTIASPNSNTNRTLTLPDDTGTIVTNSGNQAGSFTTLNTSGQVVFNDAGADVDFRVEGDTDANLLFVDASADAVGIGTSTPQNKLQVKTTVRPQFAVSYDGTTGLYLEDSTNSAWKSWKLSTAFGAGSDLSFVQSTNTSGTPTWAAAAAMTLDASGNLLVGGSTPIETFSGIPTIQGVTNCIIVNKRDGTGAQSQIRFHNANGNVGEIYTSGSSTVYATSSDYRLKENVVPMTGALAKVLELSPVTYTWKADGSAGEGFLAHELQAVCSDAVSGEKDKTEIKQVEVSPAVPATYDEEGNELTPAVEAVYEEREVPVYQGVDTSFLVATLTAAIQELKAELDEAKARIAALEGQ